MTDAPLWTRDDLAGLPGATLVGEPGDVSGVSIDSRTLKPGELYCAIRGVAQDGHDYVRAAFAAGAGAALVARDRAAEFAGAGPLVAVPDVLHGLGDLARASRARSAARIVAVTGSVGKTGTKEALRLVLSRFGRTHAAAASFNNHWGVPLTLARMPRGAAFGVFEIGMNHPGEIVPLTAAVRPEVAIVTAVEPVHIAHFRSVSGIADAKGEIFSGLEPGGIAVIPRDSPHHGRLAAHAGASRAGRILSFGEGREADVRALRITTEADASFVEADVTGRTVAYRIGMAGRHVALNSLAVLAAVVALGLDVGEAAAAYAELAAPSGRGERIRIAGPGGEVVVVDESFNANPASMRAALEALPLVPLPAGGRRLAVLADMGELGETGPAAHLGLADAVAAGRADLVFAAGPLMRGLYDALPASRRGAHAASAAELEPIVLDAVRGGDVVLVKGSKSTNVSKIVPALRERFGRDGTGGRASAGGRG